MNAVGAIAALLLIVVAGAVVMSIPDIRHYRRIRNM
jgi:hypothetical protein